MVMISAQETATFKDSGILHIKGAVPKNKVHAAKEDIFRELERLKIRAGGKWHTKKLANITTKLTQAIAPHDSFLQLISPELIRDMSELAGVRLFPAQEHPQVLVTPPQGQPWRIPHIGWHVDISKPADDSLPGIQVFFLVDHLVPRGGATVAIAGSHRLHELAGGRGKNPLQMLREDAYFSELFASSDEGWTRYLQPKNMGNIPLHVIEMCGHAGDLYLMDMRILHAPAPNSSKNARMMLTSRYLTNKDLIV